MFDATLSCRADQLPSGHGSGFRDGPGNDNPQNHQDNEGDCRSCRFAGVHYPFTPGPSDPACSKVPPAAALPLPFSRRAPSFLFSVNRSLASANASFTNALLPITAPSVKYLTRHRSIAAIPRSGKSVPLESASNASAVFICGRASPFFNSARPLFLPKARPIVRR